MILDLPVLKPSFRIFTPSDRGVLDLAVHPTFKPVCYAHYQFQTANGEAYVLPLVSVFDPASDKALTIALPADANIPHLQVEWKDARTLRLTFGHRGMGGGKPSRLRILFATHPADYRSALASYAARYPAYFEIAHAAQQITKAPSGITTSRRIPISRRWNVRTCVSSGRRSGSRILASICPTRHEWFPWTYAKWWSLGKMMSDRQINDFIDEMHRHANRHVLPISTSPSTAEPAARAATRRKPSASLKQRFANALVKDVHGQAHSHLGGRDGHERPPPVRPAAFPARADSTPHRSPAEISMVSLSTVSIGAAPSITATTTG